MIGISGAVANQAKKQTKKPTQAIWKARICGVSKLNRSIRVALFEAISVSFRLYLFMPAILLPTAPAGGGLRWMAAAGARRPTKAMTPTNWVSRPPKRRGARRLRRQRPLKQTSVAGDLDAGAASCGEEGKPRYGETRLDCRFQLLGGAEGDLAACLD